MHNQDIKPSIILRQKRAARLDLICGVLCVFLFIALSLYWEIEFVEAFYQFTRAHEEWDLDEIFVCLSCFGIVSIIYAIRRSLDMKQLNREVIYNAYFDYITDLPNRKLAIDRIGRSIAKAKQQQQHLALLFVDINDFKHINDTYGQIKGDTLLHLVGKQLSEVVTYGESIARFGGDKFLITKSINDSQQIDELVSRLQNLQSTSITLADISLRISFSIGIASYPSNGTTTDSIITAADVALYTAKNRGKGSCVYYSDSIGQQASQRYYLSLSLKEAINNDELHMVYQPIVSYPSQEILGYEALLRWKHKDEFINPETIVSIAEEFGFMGDIDRWVLRCALRKAQSSLTPTQKMHINISSKQFQDDDFYQSVMGIIGQTQVDPKRVALEITESAFISDFKSASEQIIKLQQTGFEIAIDDFGTGYSSLLMLKDLEVNVLKIDRSFIMNLEHNTKDQGIVNSTLILADSLGIQVVVEGVETQEQCTILQTMGADSMQGYYFSKPLDADLINKDFHITD